MKNAIGFSKKKFEFATLRAIAAASSEVGKPKNSERHLLHESALNRKTMAAATVVLPPEHTKALLVYNVTHSDLIMSVSPAADSAMDALHIARPRYSWGWGGGWGGG